MCLGTLKNLWGESDYLLGLELEIEEGNGWLVDWMPHVQDFYKNTI
jgi:hypothetical protein